MNRQPYIFNNTVGTDPVIAFFHFDSFTINNDSAADELYSLDGGNTWQTVKAGEGFAYDRICDSSEFQCKASAGSLAVRFVLWRQGFPLVSE